MSDDLTQRAERICGELRARADAESASVAARECFTPAAAVVRDLLAEIDRLREERDYEEPR